MYELKNGTARLVNALEGRKEDPEAIAAIASALFYCEDQLIQDIQALADFYELHKED